MSIVLIGSTSGSITLQEPAISGSTVIDLPATSGTMVVTGGAQTVQFAAGSASTPSITFTGDTNTGIFSPGADTIAFTEGGTESMRITSAGNVGIGTSSPAFPLDVRAATSVIAAVSTTGTNSAYMFVSNTGGDFYLGRDNSAGNSFGGGAYSANIYSAGAYPMVFWTNATERMRLTSAGDLLIGETGGNSKLSITQSSNSSTAIRIVYSGAGAFPIEAITSNASYDGAGIRSRVQNLAAGTGYYAFSYYNDNSGAYRFTVLGNGNCQNTNGSYGAFSDIKLKENIVDATPKLEKLNQVRVVSYNLKENPKQKLLGVVAQELEQIFPSMIEEIADKDADNNSLGTTTKSVKYSVFVPMLIKAIQEQQAIITDLKARIETLENK